MTDHKKAFEEHVTQSTIDIADAIENTKSGLAKLGANHADFHSLRLAIDIVIYQMVNVGLDAGDISELVAGAHEHAVRKLGVADLISEGGTVIQGPWTLQ